jgi:capsular exopolysaccharide synthesis family protein
MSHIFDALQRAETERSGVELDAFDLPTELLQIAESSSKVRPARTEVPEATIKVSMPALTVPASESIHVEESEENLAASAQQFESLPVSLLPHNKLVSVTQKDGLAAEKFRFLAVRLRQLQQQRRSLKNILITSTIPEEGKSTMAANLACTLASRRQQKTLLVEGDLRRPGLLHQFGLPKTAGLSEYLQGIVNTTLPVYRLDALGIWFLPAGRVPPNPLELMQGGRLSPLMEKLGTCFDWIIIDSPPVLPLADTSVWTRLADGILLVARQGTTEKEQMKRGLEAIDRSKLLGALVNSSSNAAHNDYYQRYGPAANTSKKKDKKTEVSSPTSIDTDQ